MVPVTGKGGEARVRRTVFNHRKHTSLKGQETKRTQEPVMTGTVVWWTGRGHACPWGREVSVEAGVEIGSCRVSGRHR